jgi:hypothetical protein
MGRRALDWSRAVALRSSTASRGIKDMEGKHRRLARLSLPPPPQPCPRSVVSSWSQAGRRVIAPSLDFVWTSGGGSHVAISG